MTNKEYKIGDLVRWHNNNHKKGIILNDGNWDTYFKEYCYQVYWFKEKRTIDYCSHNLKAVEIKKENWNNLL